MKKEKKMNRIVYHRLLSIIEVRRVVWIFTLVTITELPRYEIQCMYFYLGIK